MVSPSRRREAVLHLVRRFRVSERRACRVLSQHRSTQRYAALPADYEMRLVKRMNELAAEHPRWGYRMVGTLLRSEGWRVNRKRVARLWRLEENRVPPRRFKASGKKAEGVPGNAAWKLRAKFSNHIWGMDSIPGVGPALAATFIAEIGDIWRFDDFDQLASYAGVHPKEQSSGNKGANPETSWRMAKTGNAYLRSAAYSLAIVGIQHNPVIRAHYLRKRVQGKSAMNAVGHCMSKALALVWGVWRSGQVFDPTLGGPKS